MIELNPVLAALMTEALAVLLVLLPVYLVVLRRRRTQEHRKADQWAKKIQHSVDQRREKLQQLLDEKFPAAKAEIQNHIAAEIKSRELAFYQLIMQMFLSQDTKKFREIDQCLDNLSTLYLQLLDSTAPAGIEPGNTTALSGNQLVIRRLEQQNEHLSRQLQAALQSMDEISSEYARMFDGKKSEMELQNSSKKMLRIFRDAEMRVKESLNEPTSKES